MSIARILSLGAICSSLCVVTASAQSTDVPVKFPATWKYPAGGNAAFAQHAMVASSSRVAAAAGVEILKAGGNAVDAAVAVGFALAVVYPEAGNIGGGGYMIIRMADGRTAAIDYREVAPAAATRDMFADSLGRITSFSISGRSASGVPGAVAGLTAVHAKFGVLPLAKVMEPAIRLADGYVVDSALAHSIAGGQRHISEFSGAQVFIPNGKPIAVGSRLVQSDLAHTLRLIASKGRDGFYRGETAEKIAAEMQRGCPSGIAPKWRASHGCGLITLEDLAKYKPAWRNPITTGFRGYSLLTMPPSSSGGITVSETLNILAGFPSLPAFGTSQYTHLLASAFQRAFIDRNSLLGDPDFVKVPTEMLASRAHADKLRATIDPLRATPTPSVAKTMREGTETTQYSVVDAAGNAVSTTTTLNSLFGSKVFVTGGGFFLNDEMDDFSAGAGHPNMFGLIEGEANAIAPGKRMLSAMSPTIVLDSAGKVFLVIGARGGPRIITSTAQVILNVIENHMSLSDAMNAPRIHHQALPDTLRIDDGGFEPAVTAQLQRMGYTLQPQGYIGGSTVAIRRVPHGWEGMDDPRGYLGGAVGY